MLPPDWQVMDGPSGRYYYNLKTQETSYTPPGAAPMPPPPGGFGAPPMMPGPPGQPGFGAVGADAYQQAYNDPRYQQMVGDRMAPLQAQGLGYQVPVEAGTMPANGGAPRGGDAPKKAPADEKPSDTLWAHRLRAMPFLARNMGMVTSGVSIVIGVTIFANYPYHTGITPVQMAVFDGATGQLTPKTVQLNSSYGDLQGLWCLAAGIAMMAFEYYTYGNREVRVEKQMWQIRVVGYFLLAVPGYATFVMDDLMPPLLPSIFGTITMIVNILACQSTLPDEKAWRWAPLGDGAAAAKKAAEHGGKPPGLFDQFNKKELDEQGNLPRVMFLASYFTINVVIGLHAYFRHALSEKGKALRGEAFLGCPVTNREYGEGGISPLPVCWIQVPCPTPDGGFLCPNGQPPLNILEANPPLLQTFWVGFGWLGYPTAKMMGQLLNLNCAILLMPVTHSMITKAHDLTSIYGPPSLHWISKLIPFDKAVVFHKACAKYFILPMVFIHAVLHYFNYGRAPYYNAVLGNGVYPATPKEAGWGITYGGYGLTGQIIVIAMFFIYCGAHEKVKRAHYETFWNTHHCFIIFFVALYFHGSVFWQWGFATVLPYAIDRVFVRILMRGTKEFALARVFFWGKPGKPDVVTLQFENSVSDKGIKPMHYMEGHYLYLQCPHVETGNQKVLKQWHPFTISSAPDEPVLEVNIRVNPSKHSWTNQMASYLQLYDPANSGAVEFVSRNTTTGSVTLGKVMGADGLPFFHVDGPHGAPSQHVFCYNSAMVVGAGIGVTPCSSIMRGVVNYRWKKGYTPNNIYFFWVARLSDLVYFKWLLVMLPELKANELVHNEYYGGDNARAEQVRNRLNELKKSMNVDPKKKKEGDDKPKLKAGWAENKTPDGQTYYTNKATGETSWNRPEEPPMPTGQAAEQELLRLQAQLKEAGVNQRKLECTLYLTGAKPDQLKFTEGAKPGSDKDLVNSLIMAKDPNTGEPYIHLKAGRPDWPGEFKSIAQTHGREDIGVIFCGAPMIAAALKENCEKVSSKEGTVFRLHKENF